MKPAIEPVIRIRPSLFSRMSRPTAEIKWSVPVMFVWIIADYIRI